MSRKKSSVGILRPTRIKHFYLSLDLYFVADYARKDATAGLHRTPPKNAHNYIEAMALTNAYYGLITTCLCFRLHPWPHCVCRLVVRGK